MNAEKRRARGSERSEEARAAWREQQRLLDARKLVVIDECGSNIGLTPVYTRALKGKRAYDSAPRTRGKNTTLIAALTFAATDPLRCPTLQRLLSPHKVIMYM